MRKLYIFLCCLVLELVATSFQVPRYTNVFRPGNYLIKLPGPTKETVTCSIKVIKYSPEMVHGGWWGIAGSYAPEDRPQSVIGGISFWINKKEIVSPLSSFADLADPSWAKLQKIGRGYRLIMIGGDAASTYDLTIDFNNGRVTRRTVTGGQMPGKPSETTQYGLNKPAEF